MKEILNFNPGFDPTSKTLDFSLLPNFDIDKVYAIINVSRNTPIYVPGTTKYGYSSFVGSVLTLLYNTTSHSTSDKISVYYDTKAGIDSNVAEENGGNLQALQETCNRMLKELQVLNYVLATGLNIKREDVDSIREDLFKGANNVATD